MSRVAGGALLGFTLNGGAAALAWTMVVLLDLADEPNETQNGVGMSA